MITRKEFDESVAEITEKATYVAQGLESLWHFVNNSLLKAETDNDRNILRIIADRIESVQFNGYANPRELESKMRFHKFYDVLDENERIKNLDQFIKYENTLKRIKELVKDI